jgi:hypothetical protein
MKLAFYILFFLPGVAIPQGLTEGSAIKIPIEGSNEVVLYAAHDCVHCYYYLPTDLKVTTKPGNTIPEISLTTWKNDETSVTSGGILHFLAAWGLSAEREKTVKEILTKRDSLAVIIGPVQVNGASAVIDGKDNLAEILNASLQNRPLAPTTPGSKMAFSFRLTERNIADFLYYTNHPEKTNSKLKTTYTYAVRTADGQERINVVVLSLPFKKILTLIKESK